MRTFPMEDLFECLFGTTYVSGTRFSSLSWKIQQSVTQNSEESLKEKIGVAEQTLFVPKKCSCT